MPTTRFRFLFCAAVFLSGCAVGGNFRIVRVWTDYRDVDSFMRISEYFDGKENTGSQTILRSNPKERRGFYFLTRIANPSAPIESAQLELHVISPDAPEARVFRFRTTIPKGSHVFNIGVTGEDWKDRKAHPVAWQVRVLDANGLPLAEEKSFLWSKPDGV